MCVPQIRSTAERETAFEIKFEFAIPHVKGCLGYISLSSGTLGRCGLSECHVQGRIGWAILASFCGMVSKGGVRYSGLFFVSCRLWYGLCEPLFVQWSSRVVCSITASPCVKSMVLQTMLAPCGVKSMVLWTIVAPSVSSQWCYEVS